MPSRPNAAATSLGVVIATPASFYDGRDRHQEHRREIGGGCVHRDLAGVAGVLASLEQVVGLIEPQSGGQVFEVVQSQSRRQHEDRQQ